MSWHRIAFAAVILLMGVLTAAERAPNRDNIGAWHAKPTPIGIQPNAPSEAAAVVLLAGQ
jgi:hypothetical protein